MKTFKNFTNNYIQYLKEENFKPELFANFFIKYKLLDYAYKKLVQEGLSTDEFDRVYNIHYKDANFIKYSSNHTYDPKINIFIGKHNAWNLGFSILDNEIYFYPLNHNHTTKVKL